MPEVVAERQSIRLRLRISLDAPPGELAVAVSLFPDDPNHHTFINIYEDDALTQAVLDRSRARFGSIPEPVKASSRSCRGFELGQLLVVVVVASAFAALRARSVSAGRRLVVAGSIFVAAASTFWFVQWVFFPGSMQAKDDQASTLTPVGQLTPVPPSPQ